MWHHGDNEMSVVGGTGDIADSRDQGDTEPLLSRMMSQDRAMEDSANIICFIDKSTKINIWQAALVCVHGVFVKKSALHESPSFSLRISFFICPFYVNVCVRRAVPCFQVSSLNTRPQSLIYLSLWGYFLFFM